MHTKRQTDVEALSILIRIYKPAWLEEHENKQQSKARSSYSNDKLSSLNSLGLNLAIVTQRKCFAGPYLFVESSMSRAGDSHSVLMVCQDAVDVRRMIGKARRNELRPRIGNMWYH